MLELVWSLSSLLVWVCEALVILRLGAPWLTVREVTGILRAEISMTETPATEVPMTGILMTKILMAEILLAEISIVEVPIAKHQMTKSQMTRQPMVEILLAEIKMEREKEGSCAPWDARAR